jgi:hypothetical protein
MPPQDRHDSLITKGGGHLSLFVTTCVVALVVVASAAAAAIALASVGRQSPWVPVLQGVLTTSFQVLAVGALGGLAKLYLDSRKVAELARDQLRDRRYRYITMVVSSSHQIDNARMSLYANRSVRTWSAIVNEEIIPARTQLRQLTHDLRNWSETGQPVFASNETIMDVLEEMYDYLGALVDEYADNKLRLSEIQRRAEDATGDARSLLLDEIWTEIRRLQLFGDFADDAEVYDGYRSRHLAVLRDMRLSLLNP